LLAVFVYEQNIILKLNLHKLTSSSLHNARNWPSTDFQGNAFDDLMDEGTGVLPASSIPTMLADFV